MLLDIFKRKKKNNKETENLYSFNSEDIEKYNKIGKEKINKLNDNTAKKEHITDLQVTSSINIMEIKEAEQEETNIVKENNQHSENNKIQEDFIDEGISRIIPIDNDKPKISYINLSKDNQKEIMNNWKNTNINELDEYIKKGQDLLNHNYTINYCDDAYEFVKEIRDKYSVIIKYLIGFNNEKHGEYDKTIFGQNIEDEWHYLNNYIKLLEKIKNLKK